MTLSFLRATGPCQWPRYTVPKDPEPIRGPVSISSGGISQSSIDSRAELGLIFLDDSSAERALGRHGWRLLVGEPPADWVRVGDEEGDIEPWYPDVELVAIVLEEWGGAKLLNAPFIWNEVKKF